ncbi:heavy metal translocating P-type ATPase [Desulfolutivibrio sulfoxidireducens]|uniref:heavy metal translocating P-type ATPase n=1 Tax=Desulfolutivibrio sulfoxidireducens TaxID=2773299 RepID=UPI00159E25C5|nr:heavy metal translocating P-type ATPase [Desulfolutivibrio sulfoxidireducens]QLA18432.1 heavy metal translocating P-type ATPase [Desulfolutivibrio sulfoxidireducens]
MNETPERVMVGQDVGRFTVAHVLPCRVRLTSPLFGDPSFDAGYFQAMVEAVPGVDEVRINARGKALVVAHDGRAETWRRLAARLEDVPDEAYHCGRAADSRVSLGDVAAKGLLTLAATGLPYPAKAAVSWGVGLPTIVQGAETLVTRGLKVEVLDGAAITLSLLRGHYFTAGAITTLLALGRYLEDSTEKRSTALLKGLLRPQAETLWVVRDGVESEIPASQVQAGDVVVCGAGELIPIDGVVAEGEASVNQSSISGESVPVHIRPGDTVISGSVVEEGRLLITVDRVGSETSLARISRFIEQSLRGKSKTQTKSSELADKLVPLTLALAGIKLVTSRDMNRAASVLTVDFSCAVKLASPVAVRSGMYAAGKAGVLLKGASALDALHDVDTIVFDKTGTLTTGEIAVTDLLPADGLGPEELLSLAAGAEEHYDHPVARAVVREAKARKLPLPPISRVDFIVAHGVSATIDGQNVLVGSHHFIAEDEGVPCEACDQAAHDLRRQGKSLLYVAREKTLLGIIALRDDPRPEAGAVLDALKAAGITRVVVLTGDHRETANALARQLPQIDEIHHELKPEDKAAIVAELKKSGRKLAYVGDGVNDAPALMTADVGICMPNGADLAREAAQVLLLSEDLHALPTAKKAAMRTNTIVKHCFYSTIGLNSLILFMAGSGLSPLASALLHNVSTVGILGYAAMAAGRPLDRAEKSAHPSLSTQEVAS